MKRLIVVASLGLLLTGCKTTQEYMKADGYRELRGDELKKLVVGNTVKSSTGWADIYKPDGDFSGISPRSGSYKGTWYFSNDGLLSLVKNHPNVPNGCTAVYQHEVKGDIVWFEADNNQYSVTIAPAK